MQNAANGQAYIAKASSSKSQRSKPYEWPQNSHFNASFFGTRLCIHSDQDKQPRELS